MSPNRTPPPSGRRAWIARLSVVETPPWGVATALIAILAAFGALVVGTLVAQAWLAGTPYVNLAGWLIGALIALLFVLQTRRSPDDRAALRLGAGGPPLPFVLFVMLGVAFAFDLLSLAVTGAFVPVPELLALVGRAPGLVDWLIAFAFMLLAQPIAEELVFRGVAFPALRAALGAWAGLIVTAMVYAGFHLLAYPPDYVGATPTTALWYGLALPLLNGLVISGARAYTGSTRAAIVTHAAFGLFALLKLLTMA